MERFVFENAIDLVHPDFRKNVQNNCTSNEYECLECTFYCKQFIQEVREKINMTEVFTSEKQLKEMDIYKKVNQMLVMIEKRQ